MGVDDVLGFDDTDPLHVLARAQKDADLRLFEELRELRVRRGLTQQQVAERMEIDQSTVARIESGRRDVHLSTLRLYALALHVSIEHVVVDVEDPATGLPALNRRARTSPSVLEGDSREAEGPSQPEVFEQVRSRSEQSSISSVAIVRAGREAGKANAPQNQLCDP